MQRDRHRQVVPTIARIEQAIIVSFVVARKENNEATANVALYNLENLGNTRETEDGPDTKNCDNGCLGYFWLGQQLAKAFRHIVCEFGIQLQLEIFGRGKVLIPVVVLRYPFGKCGSEIDFVPFVARLAWWQCRRPVCGRVRFSRVPCRKRPSRHVGHGNSSLPGVAMCRPYFSARSSMRAMVRFSCLQDLGVRHPIRLRSRPYGG